MMVKSNMADVTTPYNLRRMLKGVMLHPTPSHHHHPIKLYFYEALWYLVYEFGPIIEESLKLSLKLS